MVATRVRSKNVQKGIDKRKNRVRKLLKAADMVMVQMIALSLTEPDIFDEFVNVDLSEVSLAMACWPLGHKERKAFLDDAQFTV